MLTTSPALFFYQFIAFPVASYADDAVIGPSGMSLFIMSLVCCSSWDSARQPRSGRECQALPCRNSRKNKERKVRRGAVLRTQASGWKKKKTLDTIVKGSGTFLQPVSLRGSGKSSCCFPDIKDSYLSEPQAYLWSSKIDATP